MMTEQQAADQLAIVQRELVEMRAIAAAFEMEKAQWPAQIAELKGRLAEAQAATPVSMETRLEEVRGKISALKQQLDEAEQKKRNTQAQAVKIVANLGIPLNI